LYQDAMQSFYRINSNDFFLSMPVLMNPCPFLGWNHICSPDFTLWQSLICETYLDKVKTRDAGISYTVVTTQDLYLEEWPLSFSNYNSMQVVHLCFLNSFEEEEDCLLTPSSNFLVFSFASVPILNTANRNGRWAWQLMLNILISVVGLDSMISQVHRTVSFL